MHKSSGAMLRALLCAPLRYLPAAALPIVSGKLYCSGGSDGGGLFLGTVFDDQEIYQP